MGYLAERRSLVWQDPQERRASSLWRFLNPVSCSQCGPGTIYPSWVNPILMHQLPQKSKKKSLFWCTWKRQGLGSFFFPFTPPMWTGCCWLRFRPSPSSPCQIHQKAPRDQLLRAGPLSIPLFQKVRHNVSGHVLRWGACLALYIFHSWHKMSAASTVHTPW